MKRISKIFIVFLVIVPYMSHADTQCALDIDGDGKCDALTDGLLIMRYLFGFRGDALLNSALSPNATRNDDTLIINYINSLKSSASLPSTVSSTTSISSTTSTVPTTSTIYTTSSVIKPRFTKNINKDPASPYYGQYNGTVTDNVSKLILLADANCLGSLTWSKAKNTALSLDGRYANPENIRCGLTDNSLRGSWRLPTYTNQSGKSEGELAILAVASRDSAFKVTDVTNSYWSGTTLSNYESFAWYISPRNEFISSAYIGNIFYVWPVRDP